MEIRKSELFFAFFFSLFSFVNFRLTLTVRCAILVYIKNCGGVMKIYLLRHGESEGNLRGFFLGHADWDLSALGYKQAEIAADALSCVNFDKVYSSDLKRAYNTAKPHAALRGLEVIPVPELRELCCGDWEERRVDDIAQENSLALTWRESFGTFVFPGGESVADAAERVYDALAAIAEENPDATVLCGMHAAVICAFWCKISGFPKEEWAKRVALPSNCSYTVAEYKDGHFYPVEYSNDEHISAQGLSSKSRLF